MREEKGAARKIAEKVRKTRGKILTDGKNKSILPVVKMVKGRRKPGRSLEMKSWMMVLLVALCASTVLAQGRRSRNGGAAKESAEPGQMLEIKEITTLGGDSDYLAPAPSTDEKWKLKINHSDNYKKDGVNGWHYFEVAYDVARIGTNASGKKLPILVIPEVEITFAVLYDMKQSKLAASTKAMADKAGGAIGWEKPSQLNTLLTETITYTSITPGRKHYAAVCVPPSSVAVYGKPVIYSVQIKVDGIQQGDIVTEAVKGAKIDGKEIGGLLTGEVRGKKAPIAWWESILNKAPSVTKVDGILRDRSATPFIMVGDMFYDQVKN